MRELSFYKTEHGTWFIDLPAYIAGGGDPTDLQMVAGADDLLDSIAGDGVKRLKLQILEQKMRGFNQLKRLDEIPTISGRYYFDQGTDMILWLCNVVLWLFEGRFPESIYYKQA